MTNTHSFAEFAAALRDWFRRADESFPTINLPFGELALELFRLQFQHNAVYRRICEARGVTPENVRDWTAIPVVPTSAFKELELTSVPLNERTAVFCSSGTTKQIPSRHCHSVESLFTYECSLVPWFRRHVLPEWSERAAFMDFVALTPPPADAPHSSLAHMFATVQREFGPRETVFTGSVGADGAWQIDFTATQRALEAAIAKAEPVVLLGTAFSFVHLCDALDERKLTLRLPPGSRVMETGGYKGRSRELPKAQLHAMLANRLEVSPSSIVCEYGMSELSSQAYDGCAGSDQPRVFRFPPWARARVISPETGAEVADGETGLLQVFDLANVWSVLAIQTEDLAVRRGEGFELVGRAGQAEPRGCSLMPA